MRRTPGALALSALLIVFAAGVVHASEAPEPRTISVAGVGEASYAPDLAIVSFAVETTAATAAEAGAENSRRSVAVAKAVQDKLGKKDRLQTTRYSLDPVYEPRERGSNETIIRGYVARNEVRIETHAIAEVGALIDAAIGAGANRVNNLQFTLEDQTTAQSEALRQAAGRARQEAESIAASLSVKIVRVLGATTLSGPVMQPRRYEGMAMAAESRMATPIEAGDVKVTATLQVTFEIE